ncbi:MAG: methyltransferase domain-containing protein [Ignavibacteria bacterium]|nr:methyltransferase domain-containing protein [Ignavibacteria bacterium]
MFLKRSYEKEIMDDFSINDGRIDKALDELKIVNRFLGGRNTSVAGFKYLLNGKTKRPLNVLDIGSGASDIFQKPIRKLTDLKVYSLDRNKKVCVILKNTGNRKAIFGDALRLPFKKNSFAVVHASLFLHHFTEEEIIKIINISLSVANDGMIINDLRRSVFALAGIKFLTFLFSNSILVKNDAPLSVKRGFLKLEIKNILQKMNIKNFKIKRKWAFRWLIIISKKQN